MIRGEFVPTAYVRLDFPEGTEPKSMARGAHAVAKQRGMGVSFAWNEAIILVDPWKDLAAVLEAVETVEATYAATAQTSKRGRSAKQRGESAEDRSAEAGTLEAAYPAWTTGPV